MNCQNHPDAPATAYCRTCGQPLCDACRRDVSGTVFCAEHVPAPAGAPAAGAPSGVPPGTAAPPPPYGPYTAPYNRPPGAGYPTNADVSPQLALFLGMIPGVGAIYNGQYAKGLVHAVVFGILCSIADSRAAHGLEPVFGMMCFAWWAYMVFEAYHTARKRRAGEPVDEYSSLIDLRGGRDQVPVAAVALIVLGVVLLLHTLDLFDFEVVARYWPVLLIALGVYLLYNRFAGGGEREGVRHGR
jgi:cell wall-active antibiotic response 4TMS protein YvqF/B-box zinc finger protein